MLKERRKKRGKEGRRESKGWAFEERKKLLEKMEGKMDVEGSK